jgi:hypothetical protein
LPLVGGGCTSGDALNSFDSRQLAMRFPRGDPLNVRAGNANVGQFTIGQLGELAPHRLVSPPGLIKADDGRKLGHCHLHDRQNDSSDTDINTAITREWIRTERCFRSR